jgi:hypothetical protein
MYSYTAWLPPDEGWDMMGLLVTAINKHGTMDVDLPPAPPPFRFAKGRRSRKRAASLRFRRCYIWKKIAIWRGQTGDDLLDLLYKGIVRAPMLIEAQATDAKQAIINAIRSGAEAFRGAEGITMRWPYLVFYATKVSSEPTFLNAAQCTNDMVCLWMPLS